MMHYHVRRCFPVIIVQVSVSAVIVAPKRGTKRSAAQCYLVLLYSSLPALTIFVFSFIAWSHFTYQFRDARQVQYIFTVP